MLQEPSSTSVTRGVTRLVVTRPLAHSPAGSPCRLGAALACDRPRVSKLPRAPGTSSRRCRKRSRPHSVSTHAALRDVRIPAWVLPESLRGCERRPAWGMKHHDSLVHWRPKAAHLSGERAPHVGGGRGTRLRRIVSVGSFRLLSWAAALRRWARIWRPAVQVFRCRVAHVAPTHESG